MKQMTGMGVAIVLLMLVTQPAWAARTRMHISAESQEYGEKMGGMIGRGLLNVFTSFMDILVNTVNETKAGPPVIGTLTGIAKGTGCGALRIGSGVVDVATFWVPGFNGFPVSDSYENCLEGMESTAAIQESESVESVASATETLQAPETVALDAVGLSVTPRENIAQTLTSAEEPLKGIWAK